MFADRRFRPGVTAVVPDISFLEQEHIKENLLGIVITHAHEDHVGAFPYLWERLQVPVYATTITAAFLKRKMDRFGNIGNAFAINPIREDDPTVTLGPFEITWVPMTHSIPENRGLTIKTDKGTLFHTGDWCIDERQVT
jgi:ribonuclease J